MFSSSVRRAALTTPQTPIAATFSNTAQRAATSQALSYRCHQRRYSSSKPSAPASGSNSKGVAERDVATTHSRSQVKSSRKNVKDVEIFAEKGKDATMQNLPSVPSTHHIPPNQIATSLFFSLHRPISPTINFPKTVTDDAFAAIFTPRTKVNTNRSDVIAALSNTVQDLEAAAGQASQSKMGTQQPQWNSDPDELRASINAESYENADADVKHLDNTLPSVGMDFPGHILTGKYQPFNPPAAPMPMNTAESLAAGAEAAETQQKTYTSIMTIQESTDAKGEVTYMAYRWPLQEGAPMPTRYVDRMQIRQERYQERTKDSNTMLAISVKRQRKLKMKKHKYKKLMRRTRNLRRRLDRN